MDNVVILNGRRYISESLLLEAMVKACVRYTDIDDIEVTNEEANAVAAYQLMLSFGERELRPTRELFKNKYVRERFIERTVGV